MIKINVITKDPNWLRYIKDPSNYLDRKIDKINRKNKKLVKKNIFLSLMLSGNKEIKNLNKKFRNKNKSTNVLSFPFYTKNELKKKINKEKEIYLGDIIVNFYKIKEKNNNKYFKIEFDRLWIHGLVHLFGHDHKKNEDFLNMKKIEDKYFELINA